MMVDWSCFWFELNTFIDVDYYWTFQEAFVQYDVTLS